MNERYVYVVDDDRGVCHTVSCLVQGIGLTARTYDSPAAFLEHCPTDPRGCLVLDIMMPGMSGLDLQRMLTARGVLMPIVFITGHGNVPTGVAAMKAGAFDFIEKPIDAKILTEIIQRAMKQDERNGGLRQALVTFRQNRAQLTGRQRTVMDLVLSGQTVKQIAAKLNISIKTVDKHRAKVLEKMQVENSVELVRLAMSCGEGNDGETPAP